MLNIIFLWYVLAPNPTQRAKGMTVRSQCEITSNIMVAVIRMQPINMQTSAIIHSDLSSDLKQTCGLLYKVIHDHMRPNLVSPIERGGKGKKHRIKTVSPDIAQFFFSQL